MVSRNYLSMLVYRGISIDPDLAGAKIALAGVELGTFRFINKWLPWSTFLFVRSSFLWHLDYLNYTFALSRSIPSSDRQRVIVNSFATYWILLSIATSLLKRIIGVKYDRVGTSWQGLARITGPPVALTHGSLPLPNIARSLSRPKGGLLLTDQFSLTAIASGHKLVPFFTLLELPASSFEKKASSSSSGSAATHRHIHRRSLKRLSPRTGIAVVRQSGKQIPTIFFWPRWRRQYRRVCISPWYPLPYGQATLCHLLLR